MHYPYGVIDCPQSKRYGQCTLLFSREKTKQRQTKEAHARAKRMIVTLRVTMIVTDAPAGK